MINATYWDEYYSFWDKFVKNWFEQRPNVPSDDDSISQLYVRFIQSRNNNGAFVQLDLNVLPTPYLGNPDKGADAVVIHLNPGLSEIASYGQFVGMSTDATQSYENINRPIGWLIRSFRDVKHCLYRKFLNSWSCLNPIKKNPQVPGFEWWQKKMAWLRQVYTNPEMLSSRVFALELCPYHSKKFGLREEQRFYQELLPFIRKRVVDVAIVSILENKLPYAVAVGATFHRIFDRLQFPYVEWSFRHCETNCKWPSNFKQKPTCRSYRLYTVRSLTGKQARILVVWAQAPGNPSPTKEFGNVEREILNYANCNPIL